MNALLLGLSGFGNEAFRALRRAGVAVVAVLTRKETGAFPYYPERTLAEEAREAGVPVYEDPAINDLAFFDSLKALQPNFLVSATYHQKIPVRLIKMADKGAVAIHPALLPDYRGATPTTWAILNGLKETGVSLHEMTVRPFEGNILSQRKLAIDPDDTDGSLRKKLAALSGTLIEELVGTVLRDGKLPAGTPQDVEGITHFPPRTRREGLITFDEPTQNIYNRIRAVLPYPGAHTHLGEREVEIVSATPVGQQSFELQPGLITGRVKDYLQVKTKDGAILVKPAQPLADADVDMCSFSDVRALSARFVKQSSIVHTREVYGIEPGAEEFPKMVVLAVAYPCNASCPHCPYTESNSDIRMKYFDQPYVSAELFKKIARECGEYGAFLRITGGGEPMMHPDDMVSLIEYAKSVGAKVWMNTNGSRFTPEKVDRLLKAGLDMIEFSTDAGEESVYKVVRAGLDWNGLVTTMRTMVKRRNETKSPTRIVCSMVMQDLIKDKDAQYSDFWLKDVGVDEVIRRKFLTWGANTSLDPAATLDETPYLDKTKGDPCPYPYHRLNVDTRGKIEVCGFDISGRTNFGNCREKTIREIWKGPEFQWWRTMHAERRGGEIPLCRECPDWQYRSWTHNYTKVLKTAEQHRQESIQTFEHLDR